MPTTTALDTAVSELKSAADSCAYGLTDRRLKPLRIAMEQYLLCLTSLPAMPPQALISILSTHQVISLC